MSVSPGALAEQWFRAHAAAVPGSGAPVFTGELLYGEPLSKHTYYRIGGPASVLALPRSFEDLKFLSAGIRATGAPHFVLGAGSNLLVSDVGFDGVVIKTKKLGTEIERMAASDSPFGCDCVRAGGGVLNSTFLRKACDGGWGGLEFLSGVPGSVGGAVFMNAGTHLGETKDALLAADIVSMPECELSRVTGAELGYSYRKNHFLPSGALVLQTWWRITPEDPAQVKARIDLTLTRRKSTQPIEVPSCGSVFKNPKDSGLHAWQVIDRLGLRGHREGAAQFSEKHCNFIVNHGAARASDVRALIEIAKSRALRELGVTLEEEVRYLGF